MSLSELRSQFISPQDEFSPMPFWFWNDNLDENEIIRQIHDFKDKGVMGFIIHPRIGVPKTIQYLSTRYFELVQCAVNEAKMLGMKVILYDEAMYPSGSAHGRVVKENPDYRSRGLTMVYVPSSKLAEQLEKASQSKSLDAKEDQVTKNPEEHQLITVTKDNELPKSHLPIYQLKNRDRLVSVLTVREKLLSKYEVKDMQCHKLKSVQTITADNQQEMYNSLDLSELTVLYADSAFETSDSKKSTISQSIVCSNKTLADMISDLKAMLLLIETDSEGTIRGIHFGEDDGEPDAPPSTDLLNAAAISHFIELTYDRYYEALRDDFGKTIIAMFTDEPSILGRQSKPGLFPWTGGFLNDYLQDGNKITELPYLWFDTGDYSNKIRQKYRRSINKKLVKSYYGPISVWCDKHHIALTGHPEKSDDIGFLKHFQIPGQDVVWRWVAPENDLAITGEHSTMGKCSSDAARHLSRRRNANECFGCCGPDGHHWAFSADDMKWYLDWLFVRGVNMIYPHAFFYSVSGEKRYNERPPDVGPNNSWWPHYRKFSDYIKRMSWMMTDSHNQTKIAILGQEDHLSWEIARPLFENQIEFNYLEDQLLEDHETTINQGKIRRGANTYQILLIPDKYYAPRKTCSAILTFIKQGGQVLFVSSQVASQNTKQDAKQGARHEDLNTKQGAKQGARHEDSKAYDTEAQTGNKMPDESFNVDNIKAFISAHNEKALVAQICDDLIGFLDTRLPRDMIIKPAARHLRYSHIVKNGTHLFIMTNEGDKPIVGEAHFAVCGSMEVWHPWSGKIEYIPTTKNASHCYVAIERRESIVIAIDPEAKSDDAHDEARDCTIQEYIISKSWADQQSQVSYERLDCQWLIMNPVTNEMVETSRLQSWFDLLNVDTDTNNIRYETTFNFNDSYEVIRVLLDLGDVREIAEVEINGQHAGVAFWKPYRIDISQYIKSGENMLSVAVTNSKACYYEHTKYPSGLLTSISLIKESIS